MLFAFDAFATSQDCKNEKASFIQFERQPEVSKVLAQCATAFSILRMVAILLANTGKSLNYYHFESEPKLVSFLI